MKLLSKQLQEHLGRASQGSLEEVIALMIGLWDALAARMVPLIGDEAFQSLFERSLHVTSRTFPWLAIDLREWDHANHFTVLTDNFLCRTHAEVSTGGVALMTTFVETLVLLIGVPLVRSLLRSAWGEISFPNPTFAENKQASAERASNLKSEAGL